MFGQSIIFPPWWEENFRPWVQKFFDLTWGGESWLQMSTLVPPPMVGGKPPMDTASGVKATEVSLLSQTFDFSKNKILDPKCLT